jgi:hypothetical protein
MLILILLNTLGIIYLLWKTSPYFISIIPDKTIFNKTLVGYYISLYKKRTVGEINLSSFYLPIKNKAKAKLEDQISYVLHFYNHKEKIEYVTTAFAKVKTDKDIKKFEETYECISPTTVFNLVREFYIKKHEKSNV